MVLRRDNRTNYAGQGISAAENYLRTLEFNYPEWIPVMVDLSVPVWLRFGSRLEELVMRHPLIFKDYIPGSYPKTPADPFERVYDSLLDDWGCIWRNIYPGHLGQVVGHPLADWKQFVHFRAPDPLEQFDWETNRQLVEKERQAGRLAVGYMSITQGGFFDRLQFLRGMENLMIDFATDPPELSSLIEMVLDYNLEYNRLYLEAGLDLFHFHGDIGAQHGLIFSPAAFRKYLKPAYQEMFSRCRRAGTHVFYSSDGYMLSLVDDLIDCEISLHDPELRTNTLEGIQKAYFQGNRAREDHPVRLCASVQLDTQMLPNCKPEEIRQQVADAVAINPPDGGLMLYTYVSGEVPLENIEALCCALEEFCMGIVV